MVKLPAHFYARRASPQPGEACFAFCSPVRYNPSVGTLLKRLPTIPNDVGRLWGTPAKRSLAQQFEREA